MSVIHDPSFAPPREPPFPVGTSPFRQKGNAYLGDIKYYDDVVPGGFDAVVAALPDEAHRIFARQQFRASDWYDAYPGAQLEVAAARVRRYPFERHRRETGAWHATHAARGLYGALLRMVSSETVALWGPRISSIYFEFGRSDARVTGTREVLVTRRGIPHELVQWMIYASAGFTESALQLAGAREVRVGIENVVDDGRHVGRALAAVDLRISWGP
jgi:hypothetical protein